MASQIPSTVARALLLLLAVLGVLLGNHGCEGTPSDTSVLLGWKSQIEDPHARLLSWVDSPSAPCNWTGITCEGYTFQVVQINLANMSLSGEATPIIGQLQMLQSFNVATNNFTGDLPISICSWVNLEYLELSNNSFTGVPPACLSQIKQLQVMDLSYNFFVSLPAQMGLFPRLSYLSAQGCGLVGTIPPEIGNISSLASLILDGNQLTGSIPPQLGQLARLQRMHLGDNNLTGEIPSELGLARSLKYLNLAKNNLTGSIPSTLGNLVHLEEVKLFSNSLEGIVPAEIANAPGLITIDMSANSLSGSIPEEIGNLKSLRVFNLSQNGLVGQIPPSLANLPGMQVLSLSLNQLTGSIPQELGVSSRISAVDLSSNFLVGPIPPSLCSNADLSVLNLAYNFLSGSIPEQLQYCRSLQALSLTRNDLSGSLPEGIGALPVLNYLDLCSNSLSGTLDDAHFGDGSMSLAELYLQDNRFTGSVPASLGLILNLAYLDLSHNTLSGEIPPQLGNCTRLIELYLGQNNFSGSIPEEIGNNKQLQILDLSSNALTGSIPAQFGSLLNLDDLDLSNNQLNGTVPNELANVSSLRVLDLSHNNLSGPVPADGLFETIHNISVAGNSKLCGGPPGLKLPPCGAEKLPNSTKIVTIILVALSVLTFAIAIWCASRPMGAFHNMREEEAPVAATAAAPGQAGSGEPGGEEEAAAGPGSDGEGRELPNWVPDLETAGNNPEGLEGEELTVFHHGAVTPVLIEEHEAVLAPYNSPASTVSFKKWQPRYWPWKLIFLVPEFDLTEVEVVGCFAPRNLICRAWSGEMYAGVTKNGLHFVVERLLNPGKGENLPNILRRLGQFRHPHIVKMLGYCLGSENSLVAVLYEDLAGGNLDIALKSGKLSRHPFKWGSRFDIALGVVRALHYLHDHQPVYAAPLHDEITSSNILLDIGMKPYLTVRVDISELDPPRPESAEDASTSEQMLSTGCTDGRDIYNLGLVLLELLSGRQVTAPNGMHIVGWFTEALEMDSTVMDMIDPTMGDHPSTETLNQIGSVFSLAGKCVSSRPEQRPTLDEVLQYLLRVHKASNGTGNRTALKPPLPRSASRFRSV